MNWGSPAEFFAMGGYAFYVWGSFGVTAAALAIEIFGLRRRRSRALLNLRRGRAS
jgi:heme exporter protein D